jgi:hypothetical protein
MLNGKKIVFLSCTRLHADALARPIRDALNAMGYHAVILMDEPLLRGTFEPESKVDAYIDASDAFIALCTENRRVPGHTAENIIDEIGRARTHPKLREVVCVLKEPAVTLPSNINPTWEDLSSTDPDAALTFIKAQLTAWDVHPTPDAPAVVPPATLPDEFLDELVDGVRIGDHELAEQRLLTLFTRVRREYHPLVIDALFERFLAAGEDSDSIHVLSSFLEAASRIDPGLIGVRRVAALSESPVFQHRSCAASILWDMADAVPGSVPLDIVAALARPAHEDWYVYAPALAAAKQLALTRRSAWHIIEILVRSADADDRSYAASAAIGVAEVDPALVPLDLAKLLAKDEDVSVAKRGKELMEMIKDVSKEQRRWAYGKFGL